MNRLFAIPLVGLLLLGSLALTGCSQQSPTPPPAGAEPPPPKVQVANPVQRTVTDFEEFPGRIEAVNSIEVRASRVKGYLEKVNFTEGAEVKAGDVLFEIDPRPYQAELNRTEATLAQAQARLNRLESDFQRAAGLLPRNGISREEYDKIAGDRAEAAAAIGVAKANRELAALDLDYTRVRAKISGQVSRRFIDPGNMVKGDDTVLTTIVSLDPVYAYFDLDERTTLKVQRLVREGKITWSPEVGLPMSLGLVDEEGYPYKGVINFADNRIESETGTWRLRGLVENPKHILTPGVYVRIKLSIGAPFPAVLVAEKALGTDQDKRFIYVVDQQSVVQRRELPKEKVGRLEKGLRVVLDGLQPGEQVVVSGLQRIREKIKVEPTVVDMTDVAAGRVGAARDKSEKPAAVGR